MNKPLHILAALCLSTGLLSSCERSKPAETGTAAPETSASADSSGSAGGMSHSGMDHAGMGHGSAAGGSGMAAAMNAMMQEMDALTPVGNTDYDFARMMMAHHRGAVEMSALELKEGKDATLRALAQKISDDQQQELRALEAVATRLAEAPANYQPRDPADPFTSKMNASMQVMMKTDQPTGNVDHDFALLMVPHHQSAVDMAQAQVAHGRDAKLTAMARQMIAAQQQEIQQLKDWQTKNSGKLSRSAAMYECPMGDGGRSSAPGPCPKCGMDLVKKA